MAADVILLNIRFASGSSVQYTEEYRVIVNGYLWPRQLKAATEMIGIYKACSKEDNDVNKS